MFNPPERTDCSSIEGRPTLRPSEETSAVEAGLGRARALTSHWRALAGLTPEASTTRWLLHVPDIGPTCEVLLADRLFHDLTADERSSLGAWVRGHQLPRGAWLDPHGQPDLSLTVLGWWALRDAGDPPQAEHMLRAERIVHQLGGAQRSNFMVRLWLAMGGQIPWAWLPAVSSELFLLPPQWVVSPSRFSPWARGILTPYHIIARAPARLQLPDASPLLLRHNDGQPVAPRLTRPGLAGDLLQVFDRTVKLSRKLPRGALPRLAIRRGLAWIDRSQQPHGGWFSVRPTVLSLIALRVMGATSDDPRIRAGLDYLRSSRGRARIPGGRAMGHSALAQGLGAASLDRMGRLLQCAAPDVELAWLVRQELCDRGPWQARADAATGGWPHEPGAAHHLDLDSTCSALAALSTLGRNSTVMTSAWATTRRAVDVLFAMQEPDGRFSRFERGESNVLMQRLPWTDADLLAYGRPDDTEHLRLTARALNALAATGFRADDDRIARGLDWMVRAVASPLHERVSVGPLETVACVAQALGVLTSPDHPMRQAIEVRLRSRQRENGSFGDLVDTSYALQALVALGHTDVQAQRAAQWLAAQMLDHPPEQIDAWSRPVDNGLGMSPTGFDPSAGPREATLALEQYTAALRCPIKRAS